MCQDAPKCDAALYVLPALLVLTFQQTAVYPQLHAPVRVLHLAMRFVHPPAAVLSSCKPQHAEHS